MKRIFYITGLILILGLIVSGCTNGPQESHPGDGELIDATAGETSSPDTSQQDTIIDEGSPSNVSSVTLEELETLRADIEKLEAEDLGGLNN